jgi:hypothetical protein
MEALVIFIVAAILLDLAASRWAVDSTEDVNNQEWQHRQAWSTR